MILLGGNLLLYAHNTSSKEHAPTTAWRDSALSADGVCLSWETILAFLRIATTPRIFAKPLSLETAAAVIDKWLAQPNVKILSPTPRLWSIFSELLPSNRARGSLIMDAHLAALAIEHGATLCTNDRDFARFPGLKLDFPLQ